VPCGRLFGLPGENRKYPQAKKKKTTRTRGGSGRVRRGIRHTQEREGAPQKEEDRDNRRGRRGARGTLKKKKRAKNLYHESHKTSEDPKVTVAAH